MAKIIISALLLAVVSLEYSLAYSALEDARIIAEYRHHLQAKNHAKIARTLVHQANWAAVGSISTNSKTQGYPMVNIISIDDTNARGESTGKIHFLLTDLDFTGRDWKNQNKVTLLFSDEQNKNCSKKGEDPMEPTCARTMISGQVVEMKKDNKDYEEVKAAFIKRHPAAANWMKAHVFYMCELQIQNIFVLDYYGGPHTVSATEYYNANP